MGKRVTKEVFIKRSIKNHENRYDYSDIDYVLFTKSVHGIICKEHDVVFSQRGSDHARGRTSCKKCVIDDKRRRMSLGLDEFSKRVMKKFGNKFDLSKVNYINKRKKVTIVCKKHGDVFVSPEDFLTNKYGCPKCGNSMSNITSGGFYNIVKASRRQYGGSCNLYAVELSLKEFSCIKIGISTSVDRRCKDIEKSGYSTSVLYCDRYESVNDAIIAEYFYHNEFRRYVTDVPVKFDGRFECFSISIKSKIMDRLQLNDL